MFGANGARWGLLGVLGEEGSPLEGAPISLMILRTLWKIKMEPDKGPLRDCCPL